MRPSAPAGEVLDDQFRNQQNADGDEPDAAQDARGGRAAVETGMELGRHDEQSDG